MATMVALVDLVVDVDLDGDGPVHVAVAVHVNDHVNDTFSVP
jgi:hypothetical protein